MKSDSLSDTETCLSIADCRENKVVRENMMFPEPIEIQGSQEDSYKRTRITPQQAEMLQHSILTE